MSSRQEEKERRRQERLALEAEQARRDAGKRRLQWIGGALLSLVAIAVLVGALIIPAVGGGGDDKTSADSPSAPTKGGAIPPAANPELASSVQQAGCTVKTFPSEGRTHSSNPEDWKYKTNPPTSGTHDPTPAEDGVYPFGVQPSVGMTTHALEHGRIDIQYGPGITRSQYGQLQTLVAEDGGYHQLLFSNQTRMPFAVAATAWTQMLGCKTFTPKVFDAIRNFKKRYTDQAPESVP